MDVGERIGRYELLRLLGRGGSGTVHLATDPTGPRLVAVKTLHPELATGASRERFDREARIVRSILHPNVARCLDVGEHEGQPFIVFEFIAGVSLEQLVQRGEPLDPRAALSIWQDVCYALYAVHKAGIVHRDVKPHNVLITAENVVKLIDFGIATGRQEDLDRLTPPVGVPVEEGGRITPPDRMMGTPFFSAPELLAGEAPTAAADVYALGLIVAELLLGGPVYDVKRRGDLASAQLDLPDSLFLPERRIPPLPAGLDEVLARMLAFRRDDRYRSAVELFRDLEPLIEAAPGDGAEWTEALRTSKETARVEITEACYWSGANLSSEGRHVEALLEYEQLLTVQSRRVALYRGKLVSELRFLLWILHLESEGSDERGDAGNTLLTLAAMARLLERLDDPFGLTAVNRRAARWIRKRSTAPERRDAAQALRAMGPFATDPFVLEILVDDEDDPAARDAARDELDALRRTLGQGPADPEREAGAAELLRLHGQVSGRKALDGLLADTRSFLSVEGPDPRLWESMAALHEGRNEFLEGDACWREAAFLRLRRGENAEALHDFKKVLDGDPENREGLLGLFELVTDRLALPPFTTFAEGAKLALLGAGMGRQATELLRKFHGESPRCRERYENFIRLAGEMGTIIPRAELRWDLALTAWKEGDEATARRDFELCWKEQNWPSEGRRERASHPAMKALFSPLHLARLVGGSR